MNTEADKLSMHYYKFLYRSNSHSTFRCSPYSSELHPYQMASYLGLFPKQQTTKYFRRFYFSYHYTTLIREKNKLF